MTGNVDLKVKSQNKQIYKNYIFTAIILFLFCVRLLAFNLLTEDNGVQFSCK